jgi:hypothetical protein
MMARRALILLGVAALFIVAVGCASGAQSSSPPPHRVASKNAADRVARSKPRKLGKLFHWRIVESPAGRHVVIGKFVPWCPDYPKRKPRIQWVRKESRGKKVVLTAFLVHPAPHGCPAVEAMVSTPVFLNEPIRNRALYDGSVQPPVQRWPR